MIADMVSVITPCYNVETYLPETIDSVLAQTYPDWEMILVDDGSTDRSAEIAAGYAARDARIRLAEQPNAGSAAARNRGIRMARGRYIALLDADDVWEPGFLEEQLSFLQKKQAVCVCCSYRQIDESSREFRHPVAARPVITERDMLRRNYVGCLTGLYDSARYGKIYLHEELGSFRDDYAYWLDIVRLEGRIYGNPAVLAGYRTRTGSATAGKGKLVREQYRFYRGYLGLGRVRSLRNLFIWCAAGLVKCGGGRRRRK